MHVSRLGLTREKIYRTVARQLHGVVPCWVCGEHVPPETATLEHILPISLGGNGHAANLAISHAVCNAQRHPARRTPGPAAASGHLPLADPATQTLAQQSVSAGRAVVEKG